jgi:hypothetical protein
VLIVKITNPKNFIGFRFRNLGFIVIFVKLKLIMWSFPKILVKVKKLSLIKKLIPLLFPLLLAIEGDRGLSSFDFIEKIRFMT